MEPAKPPNALPATPATLRDWVDFFGPLDLPVLRHTARQIEALGEDIDRVDARSIADAVLQDPLMTLKVFAWSARTRSRRQVTDIETIEPVVLMSGVYAFFREFAAMPTVELQLQGNVKALAGLLRVVNRAYRAATYARDWALRRRDLDTEVILIGAMLHDFAELLMWLYAPALALEVETRLNADSTLRSADVQRTVFGVRLADLEYELVRHWHLPELLISVMDDRHAEHPRVRNVLYAVNLARHSARSWDNAALGDDFGDIAALLNMTPEHVAHLVVPAQFRHHHLTPEPVEISAPPGPAVPASAAPGTGSVTGAGSGLPPLVMPPGST